DFRSAELRLGRAFRGIDHEAMRASIRRLRAEPELGPPSPRSVVRGEDQEWNRPREAVRFARAGSLTAGRCRRLLGLLLFLLLGLLLLFLLLLLLLVLLLALLDIHLERRGLLAAGDLDLVRPFLRVLAGRDGHLVA